MTTDMTDKIWTAPAMERRPWPGAADERASLEAFLDFHRETLLLKCAGLTGEQLGAKSVPSSNLILLGLRRHLAPIVREITGVGTSRKSALRRLLGL